MARSALVYEDPPTALVDAGPLIAFYNRRDDHHNQIVQFFEQSKVQQFITTDACIAEAMYGLSKVYGEPHKAQAQLSQHINEKLWQRAVLAEEDFIRIAELFEKYSNVPADFADLTLVVISESLGVPHVVSLDDDFNIYRRFNNSLHSFVRIFYPHTQKK